MKHLNFLLLFLISSIVHAAPPLSFVILGSSGSQSDTVIRYFEPMLKTTFNRDIVVESKPGGNGIIGMDYVRQKPADGNTVLVGNSALAFIDAQSSEHTELKNFVPLVGFTNAPAQILVSGKSSIFTINDLIKLHKTKKPVFCASVNPTTLMIIKTLSTSLDISCEVIGYKNLSELALNLSSNMLDYTVSGAGNMGTEGLITSGMLRPIAIISHVRNSAHPGVQTTVEAGYNVPEEFTWTGFFVRRDMPENIKVDLIEKLTTLLGTAQAKAYENDRGGVKLFPKTSAELQEILMQEKHDISKYLNLGTVHDF
jgi:tripartite-type tricarboxylate transporter receptor subunit TctC